MATPKPAWWRERAAARRLLLDEAVRRLRIWLPTVEGARGAYIFGSYARGDVGPDSDLDVVIVQDTDAPFFERGSLFYGSSFRRELQAPVDLLVYTPAELEELQVRRQFFADIVAQGLWIDASRPA